MQTKICERCKNKFATDKKNRRFCGRKCADLWHGESLKTLSPIACKNCGKIFQPKNHKRKFCCKKCGDEGKIKRYICEGCGEKFRSKRRGMQKYCSQQCYHKYGDHKFYSPGQHESNENKHLKKMLDQLGLSSEREFHLGKYYFDFKIGDTLIELNPHPFHNCTWSPTGKVTMTKDYHYNKYKYAKENGFKCIMIWDWTSNLIDMITNERFHYEGPPQLHYYNPKTKEHIIRKNRNKSWIKKGFVEIRDCGKETF